jgi:histidyl-tRNA synthetase
MFRYERPQKGRLREFHQFGAECFGESNVYEDANIILMLSEILSFFGIHYTLQLNSLGDQSCMPQYKEKLVSHLQELTLCEDCNRRILSNPIRVLDCKNESCQSELINAPKITENLCESCNTDFEKLKLILDTNNIQYEVDSSLVRGLDYYTQTAFEFVSSDIGAQSAIAGVGSYVRLVEFLGGRPSPGIGFAIGIERLLELIKVKESKEEILYIGAMSEEAIDIVFSKVFEKRKTMKVISDYKNRGFGKHLNNAQKQHATMVALMGENEVKDNTIWVKDLITKEEKTISINDL